MYWRVCVSSTRRGGMSEKKSKLKPNAEGKKRSDGGPSELPCVVMIPGTLCDERIFHRQKHAFRGIANVKIVGYRDLGRNVDWAAALLAQLPQRFCLVGFSLGGLWALELLRRAPERIERLAMVASNALGAGVTIQRKTSRLWRLWRVLGPGAVAQRVKPEYFHHEMQRRRHARMVHDMALSTDSKVAHAEFNWAASRPDGHADLARFPGPLLIVSGAKDRLCTPAMQRSMVMTQPNAQWVELPRVGHFVPLEASPRLSDALRQWISLQTKSFNDDDSRRTAPAIHSL